MKKKTYDGTCPYCGDEIDIHALFGSVSGTATDTDMEEADGVECERCGAFVNVVRDVSVDITITAIKPPPDPDVERCDCGAVEGVIDGSCYRCRKAAAERDGQLTLAGV